MRAACFVLFPLLYAATGFWLYPKLTRSRNHDMAWFYIGLWPIASVVALVRSGRHRREMQ